MPTAMQSERDRGRTIREAIMIALEALAGHPSSWLDGNGRAEAMRSSVIGWVHDYARRRGVILDDRDITTELDVVVATIAPAAEPPPLEQSTVCRCGARVVRARMGGPVGKMAAFEPDADGEWVVDSQGVATLQGKAPAFQPKEQIVPRWRSHFEVCPPSRAKR